MSPYSLDSKSIRFKNGILDGNILKTINSTTSETVNLPLRVTFLESGLARVTIDEEKRQKGEIELRHESKANKARYNDADKWSIAGGLAVNKEAPYGSDVGENQVKIVYGKDGKHEAIIQYKPFAIDFRRDGEVQVKINERGLLNMEHWRRKVEPPPAAEKKEGEEQKDGEGEQAEVLPGVSEDTWWDESFGGNTDSKPRGPESVAMDVTFPGYEHLYGIPEHTGPMSLKQTRKGSESDDNWDEPYRMYNADVFEYIMDSPMTLYGSIPFMQAHKKDSTVGVFWLNAAETWVDIVKSKSTANKLSLGTAGHTDSKAHWFSESGLFDLFVFLGPTPADISKTYAELTGYTAMPQYFAIAYHQCRWNYVTDEDVKDVDRKFDRANIPYDIIWLDLEYLDDRKYFTWEPLSFSNPLGMQAQLAAHERKLVVLIDPHIKNQAGYHVHDEITSKQLAVASKDADTSKPYEGWCWPGNSHWIDCFNPAANTWWATLFAYKKYTGSSSNLFIWNDMNEPSVFSGPETTMPKDNIHHGAWEHRDVHNLNGLTFHNATFEAMLARDSPSKRPFVLTRSFFAGSQRLGAMWTGDNQASWPHLKASIPMILANGISGFPFAGADVGGFFGNPEKELLTRWYQAGAFYPFFRAHAHIDTRRREPYLIGEPYTGIIAQAIRLRYSLLPSWYTAFRTAATEGYPIVRPNWWVFPSDEKGFAEEEQMYLADTGLLVRPVTEEGGTAVDAYLADAATYYDYWDYKIHAGAAGRRVRIEAPLEKTPLLMRSGHIFVRRDRPRRSSGLMKWDPYTLVVVLEQGAEQAASEQSALATGTLYSDDGESYDYEAGAFIHRRFELSKNEEGVFELCSVDIAVQGKKTKEYKKSIASVTVERVIIVGAPDAWKGRESVIVSVDGVKDREVGFEFHDAKEGKAAWAVVKNLKVPVGEGWKVRFS